MDVQITSELKKNRCEKIMYLKIEERRDHEKFSL